MALQMKQHWTEIPSAKLEGASVRFIHSYYGCESGCCGHEYQVVRGDDVLYREFDFEHDRDTLERKAGEMAAHLHIARGTDDYMDD